jgi:Initiation factor 2 subunit family
VALALLQRAAQQGVRFSVIVTEGRPDETGLSMARALDELHVPVTLVLDSGAAYILERCALAPLPAGCCACCAVGANAPAPHTQRSAAVPPACHPMPIPSCPSCGWRQMYAS